MEIVETRRYVPGDTTAAISWLKSRRPAAWRDKAQVTVTNPREALSDEDLEREIAMLISGVMLRSGGLRHAL